MTHTWPPHKRQGGLQEPANGARGGHPRTVPYPKMSSKGRTEFQISLSEAKNVVEAAGDVRFCSNPPKRDKNVEKRISETEKIRKNNFLDIEKLNVGNRPKRVLAKFRADPSHVRGV